MTHLLLDSASELALGLDSADRLPSIAAEALAGGCDSPALRTLAAMSESRAEDLVPMFDQALRDVGLRKPSRREATLHLARKVAEQIVRRELSPYQGSKRIWELTLLISGEVITELDPFIYAASEWEERPADRPFFEDAIRQAAAELTRSRPTQGSPDPG